MKYFVRLKICKTELIVSGVTVFACSAKIDSLCDRLAGAHLCEHELNRCSAYFEYMFDALARFQCEAFEKLPHGSESGKISPRLATLSAIHDVATHRQRHGAFADCTCVQH